MNRNLGKMASPSAAKVRLSPPLSDRGLRHDEPTGPLLSFLSPAELNAALEAADWSAKREIEMYARIANNEDARAGDRIAAAKALRALVIDTLRLSGALATIVTRQERSADDLEDGSSLFQTLQIQRTTNALTNTEALLREHGGGLGGVTSITVPALTAGDEGDSHEHDTEEADPEPPDGEPGRDCPGAGGGAEAGPLPDRGATDVDGGPEGGLGGQGRGECGRGPDEHRAVHSGEDEPEPSADPPAEGEAGHDRNYRPPTDPYPGLATGGRLHP